MSRLTIEVKAVAKQIDKFWALRDVSFDLEEGETLGFIGPNGSGKTTTAMLILGILRPTRGSIRTFGADPATDYQRIGSRVGVMLEKPGILDKLTGFEYLEFFGGILGIRPMDLSPRIRELLDLVGLVRPRKLLRGDILKRYAATNQLGSLPLEPAAADGSGRTLRWA